MQDIAHLIGRDKVAEVVDRFYDQVRQHPTLKIPFQVIEDWPHHKQLITHFWWVSLGGERYLKYRYEVASKHMEAGFTPALLVDWLALFRQTVEEVLEPELAGPWIKRAELIGQSLTMLHHFNSGDRPNHPAQAENVG